MRLRATIPLCLSAAVGACTHPCSPDLDSQLIESAAGPAASQSQYLGDGPDPRLAEVAAWVLRPGTQQGQYLLCPMADADEGVRPSTAQLLLAGFRAGEPAAPGPACLPVMLPQKANAGAASGGMGFLSALPFKFPLEADFGADGLLSVELSPPRCRVVPGQSSFAATTWPGLAILTPFVKLRIGDTTPATGSN